MDNITFPFSSTPRHEAAAAGLLSRADADGLITTHMREMLMIGRPTKRRISAAVLRDLSAATSTAGGYLIGTRHGPLGELMQRYSILAEAGVNVVSGFDGPVVLPSVTTVPTASWWAVEGTSMPTMAPVFGQAAVAPKFVVGFLPVSRQLLMQSAAESIVRTLMQEAVARAIDAAILAGTGSAGQPTGIVNTTGIGTQSGTSLASAGLRAMRKAPLLAGAREDRITSVGDPATQELLGGREHTSGGGAMLWADGKILGRPAVATSLAPTNTLIMGDFSRVTVTFFDAAGVEVEHDPFSNFRDGRVQFRLVVPVDVAVSPAAAFCVASSIT